MDARLVRISLLFALAGLAGCYYAPQHRRAKAHPSYLSEAEAEGLIQKRLARHGVKFISNMELKRDEVVFVADGYDRDLRVGFEYRSHEGRDFEDEDKGNPDGLTEAEIEALRARQDNFREYFLIVPEGDGESVEQAVRKFVKDLYACEVLKKKKVKKADSLFPEKNKKRGDLLPWEATGDLKKKREEMERKEEQRETQRKEAGDDDEDWQGDEDEPEEKPEKKPEKRPEKKPGPKSPPDDDVWGDDEEEDF